MFGVDLALDGQVSAVVHAISQVGAVQWLYSQAPGLTSNLGSIGDYIFAAALNSEVALAAAQGMVHTTSAVASAASICFMQYPIGGTVLAAGFGTTVLCLSTPRRNHKRPHLDSVISSKRQRTDPEAPTLLIDDAPQPMPQIENAARGLGSVSANSDQDLVPRPVDQSSIPAITHQAHHEEQQNSEHKNESTDALLPRRSSLGEESLTGLDLQKQNYQNTAAKRLDFRFGNEHDEHNDQFRSSQKKINSSLQVAMRTEVSGDHLDHAVVGSEQSKDEIEINDAARIIKQLDNTKSIADSEVIHTVKELNVSRPPHEIATQLTNEEHPHQKGPFVRSSELAKVTATPIKSQAISATTMSKAESATVTRKDKAPARFAEAMKQLPEESPSKPSGGIAVATVQSNNSKLNRSALPVKAFPTAVVVDGKNLITSKHDPRPTSGTSFSPVRPEQANATRANNGGKDSEQMGAIDLSLDD